MNFIKYIADESHYKKVLSLVSMESEEQAVSVK